MQNKHCIGKMFFIIDNKQKMINYLKVVTTIR